MVLQVSAKKLLETGAHFGHQKKRWNPRIESYLHGEKEKVHIFDLIKTKEALEEALGIISDFVRQEKAILLVGTKKQIKEKVQEVAKEAGIHFVTERWLGGTITNFGQIKVSLDKLRSMKEKREKGEYGQYTKKERVLLDREIARLERFFGGIAELKTTPDLIIVIDTNREKTAVREARQKQVTSVAIVDSNSDPSLVDYPIPMNDDATAALNYVLALIVEAVKEGKKKIKDKSGEEKKK